MAPLLLPLLFETFVCKPPWRIDIRHGGSHIWWCTGKVICSVVNKTDGSQRWLITVTVQLISTRLIIRKSV